MTQSMTQSMTHNDTPPPCQIGNWGGGGIHVIPATPELKSDADPAGEICEKYLICT
jgi:hypothetical protein